MSTLKKNKC